MPHVHRGKSRKDAEAPPQLDPVSRPLTNEEEVWRGEEALAYVRVMRPESFSAIALVKLIEDSKVSFGISLSPGAKHARKSLGLGSLHAQQAPAKTAPISRKGRMARIATEMASLAKDLPVEHGSAIFVRVDEDRPDVIKALITGPEDTPYECGLFEFDPNP